jgi:hypothetical protein
MAAFPILTPAVAGNLNLLGIDRNDFYFCI